MVSHVKVCLPKGPPTPKNIGCALGGPQRQFWKESLFVQYYKNKNVILLSALIPIKSLPKEKKVLSSLIDSSVKEGDCSDAWKFVARTVQMVVLRLKLLIFINHTFQWHMLNHSESTLLLHLCINSLPES